MIIKEKEHKISEIKELTDLLKLNLTDRQRFLVERELRWIRAGEEGENEAAYFINFHFGSLKNWTVIHDLRLECEGRVAQMDHLLIDRFCRFFVLETKNFYYGVKITPYGEFLIWNNNSYHPIESPIEQNRRHISVLEKALQQNDIRPRKAGIDDIAKFYSETMAWNIELEDVDNFIRFSRERGFDIPNISDVNDILQVKCMLQSALTPERIKEQLTPLCEGDSGAFISPRFIGYVLVSAKSKIMRPPREEFDTSMVIKADALWNEIDSGIDEESDLTVLDTFRNFISRDTMTETAKRIASLHRPIKPDYKKKFSVIERNLIPTKDDSSFIHQGYFCMRCNRSITESNVNYCLKNKLRFSGKVYCYNCQKLFNLCG